MSRHDLSWLKRQPFAHRGLFEDGPDRPENSLPAFKAAIDAKFGVELDVRASADDVAMVFHDTTLKRMTGRRDAIADMTHEALRRVRLKGGSARIPTLADALHIIAGRAPVLIEIKAGGNDGRLASSVRRALEGYRGPVGVMSFDPDIMVWFVRHAPHYPRGLVASCRDLGKASWLTRRGLSHRLFYKRAKAQFLAYDVRCLPSPFAQSVRRRGHPVISWTVRSEKDADVARQWVDNVIFERPSPAAAELAMTG